MINGFPDLKFSADFLDNPESEYPNSANALCSYKESFILLVGECIKDAGALLFEKATAIQVFEQFQRVLRRMV